MRRVVHKYMSTTIPQKLQDDTQTAVDIPLGSNLSQVCPNRCSRGFYLSRQIDQLKGDICLNAKGDKYHCPLGCYF